MSTTNPHFNTSTVAAGLASCELGGEAVILNVSTGTYYGLNHMGTFVWRLLQQRRSLAELRDLVAAHFDVPPERCQADLVAFTAALQAQGLLQSADAPSP